MFERHMSLLYVGCVKFPTNRFVRNFCPILIGIKSKLLKPLKLFLSFFLSFFFFKKKMKTGWPRPPPKTTPGVVAATFDSLVGVVATLDVTWGWHRPPRNAPRVVRPPPAPSVIDRSPHRRNLG